MIQNVNNKIDIIEIYNKSYVIQTGFAINCNLKIYFFVIQINWVIRQKEEINYHIEEEKDYSIQSN